MFFSKTLFLADLSLNNWLEYFGLKSIELCGNGVPGTRKTTSAPERTRKSPEKRHQKQPRKRSLIVSKPLPSRPYTDIFLRQTQNWTTVVRYTCSWEWQVRDGSIHHDTCSLRVPSIGFELRLRPHHGSARCPWHVIDIPRTQGSQIPGIGPRICRSLVVCLWVCSAHRMIAWRKIKERMSLCAMLCNRGRLVLL